MRIDDRFTEVGNDMRIDESAPAPGVRGKVLDWAWDHPRWKRRMREAWGIQRELTSTIGLPSLFEPPEWAALRRLAATSEPPAVDAERVLFMSWRGWSTHLAIETVLAHAVRRRGGDPVFAYCGGRLPVCDVMPVDAAPPMPCHSCREYASGSIAAAGFESVALHDVMDASMSVRIARTRVASVSSIAECEAYFDQGLPIGKLVRVSVAWFLSLGTLADTPEILGAYRSFLVSGIVVARGLRAILDRTGAQRVFMLNGTFFAERIMSSIAEERGIPFATYEKGFVHDSVVMAIGAPASHLKLPDGVWEHARDIPLGADEAEAIATYLGSRRSGGGALDNFWRHRVDDVTRIRAEQRLEPGRPLVVMFCNILWDSAVLGRDIAFPSMGVWVVGGIRWAEAHPEIDLVVRIHPAEVGLRNHPTRERMADHIEAEIPILPSNVRVIQSEDATSSYVLMDIASLGLVYTSTVGLELAARGVPVIVAADTHYRGRGFTVDPQTSDEYWADADRLVDTTPDSGERERIRDLAKRYAVVFFFRYHNQLAAVTEDGRSRPRIRVGAAGDLDPGRDPAMDRVVLGILDGIPPIAPRYGTLEAVVST